MDILISFLIVVSAVVASYFFPAFIIPLSLISFAGGFWFGSAVVWRFI